MTKPTYIITPTIGGYKITCLECYKTSYHPCDVQNLYCGFCHKFHEQEAGLCTVLAKPVISLSFARTMPDWEAIKRRLDEITAT